MGGLGPYPPLLPGDNDPASAPGQAAVAALSGALGRLLRAGPGAFWGEVLRSEGLHQALESYLAFRRRKHDCLAAEAAAGPLAGVLAPSGPDEELARRVFATYLRMVTPAGGAEGAPSPFEQGAVLYDRWLVDVPKLLDLCVLFGEDNPELCARLVAALFELQPRYRDDLAQASAALAQNLEEVLAGLTAAVAALAGGNGAAAGGAGGSSSSSRTAGRGGGLGDVRDGLRYLLDAFLSLRALLVAAPGLAKSVLGEGDLVRVAHEVDAQFLQGLDRLPADRLDPTARAYRRLVAAEAEALVMDLLRAAYLDPAAGGGGGDASEAGEAFLALLMQLPVAEGDGHGEALLHRVERRFRLTDRIKEAMGAGILRIDDALCDYFSHLLGVPVDLTLPSLGDEAEPPRRAPAAAAPPRSEFSAEQASKIGAVKDVLPDYGDGFLAACLEEHGHNPQAVIAALLDGALSPRLQALDPQLATRPPPAAADRPRAPPPPAHAEPLRKQRVHWESSRVLEDRGATDRAVRSHAAAAQWEDVYEDEYDDSMDALDEANKLVSRGRTRGETQDEREKRKAQGGGGGGKPVPLKTFWVFDGRVYHAPKEGAKEVQAAGTEEASIIAYEEKKAAEEFARYGPGPGPPNYGPGRLPARPEPQGPAGGGGRGSGRGGGGRGGRGGGGGSQRKNVASGKDKNKGKSRKVAAAKKRGGM